MLEEKAPGWSVDDVQAVTEPRLTVSKSLSEITVEKDPVACMATFS